MKARRTDYFPLSILLMGQFCVHKFFMCENRQFKTEIYLQGEGGTGKITQTNQWEKNRNEF